VVDRSNTRLKAEGNIQMVLPPNVSEADFNAALSQFRSAVGASWVFSSDEDVALYRDSYSINWGEPEERVASAAVAPAKVEEVQEIVRIANRYRIPLYPISTGRNLTYGGSAPNMRQRCGGFEAHESHHRSRRKAGVRLSGAGRFVF
jgi:hypothetical protein